MSPAPKGSSPFGSGERRAARRYDLSLPIVVCLVPHAQSKPSLGIIRDISTCGIYLITDEKYAPGAGLEFTVALPVGITLGSEVSVHAHSRVLRAEERREHNTTRTGVAAVIERIEYIRAETWPIVNPPVLNQGQYLYAKTISFRLTLSAVAGLLEMMEDGGRRPERGSLVGKILRLHKLHEDFQGLERS